ESPTGSADGYAGLGGAEDAGVGGDGVAYASSAFLVSLRPQFTLGISLCQCLQAKHYLLDSPPAFELTSVGPSLRACSLVAPNPTKSCLALKKLAYAKESHDPFIFRSRLSCRCSGLSVIRFVVAHAGAK